MSNESRKVGNAKGTSMMPCPHCGARAPFGAGVCRGCGAEIVYGPREYEKGGDLCGLGGIAGFVAAWLLNLASADFFGLTCYWAYPVFLVAGMAWGRRIHIASIYDKKIRFLRSYKSE